jgi:magnesium transporter
MTSDLQNHVEYIEKLIEEKNYSLLKESIKGHPADIADLMDELEPLKRILIFRLLQKDDAVEIFEHLDIESQSELLSRFHDERTVSIVNEMSPDDRASLFDELPAKVIKELLMRMTPDEWKATSEILGYEENTAGRIMTPEYVDLKRNLTVEEAIQRIKRIGKDKETIYYLYPIDETRHLLGVVSLKHIVLAQPETKILDIMDTEVIKVTTDDDQEEVARIIKDYDLLAVPVVDKEGRLVGIVTVDDVVDVIEEEATEDMLRMGGVEVAEKGYFKSSLINNVRKRIIWLFLMLAINTFTGIIILGQKKLLEGVIVLSAFIPILIGSGGNAGSQSATVVIRGLAIGEIELRDAFRILARESWIGIGLGILLGIAATLWAYWLQGDWTISAVVGLSFIVVIFLATTLGTFLPLLVKKIGLDPALIATPLITTTIDVTALALYFWIAATILGVHS